MHPAPSIIFFTVTSGAGYGLLAAAALAYLDSTGSAMSFEELRNTVVVALVAITLGLSASTLHLANPKNAWRAFSQYKTSWLSREGILALVTYPLALLFLLWAWAASPGAGGGVFLPAVLCALISVATVYATSMIYACLRTIPAWNNRLTPANYLLGAAMLGGVLFAATRAYHVGPQGSHAIWPFVAIGLALVAKIAYFHWIGEARGVDINAATGLGVPPRVNPVRDPVRLLDVGHSAGNFLTREFGVHASASTVGWLRIGVLLLGYCGAAVALVAARNGEHASLYLLPVALAYAGLLAERWLFFAEARHVVGHYQGFQPR
ncbi:MAG: dimethyl sulfoxide reductase anchor subunit [Gammaproteobacteria bacterium]|nr:dimethyl sulfoxide reductase anchor subunit [Gammaproteobacteria bacterium]